MVHGRRRVKSLPIPFSCPPLLCGKVYIMSDSAIPWTIGFLAPLSMKLSREEYWSGLPFQSPGDLPDLGIEPRYPA